MAKTTTIEGPNERSDAPQPFAGRVALVTGAASGIGRETALQLAQRGARVLLTDLDGAAAGRAAAELDGDIAALPLDVTVEAARPREIAEAIAFVASDAASYMTGTELLVDGGFTA